MHVLFVHKNFPAQFGHVASALIEKLGWECSFVSELPDAMIGKIRRVQYKVKSGATKASHYCSRTFENATWHSHAVYEAMKAHPEIKPDLVVGHSGFGSTLYLRDLYPAPIINYFEYYYRAKGSDMDFRPEFPATEMNILRARSRNAMLLLDLNNCDRGYSPTAWQRSLFPREYQDKMETIHDGIDVSFWYRNKAAPRKWGDHTFDANTRIVTYVSRGFESMRGFDIFMKVADIICKKMKNVVFLCVGSDTVHYGGDMAVIQAKTYKEHVLSQGKYDLDRFIFTGRVPPDKLRDVFSISDLHIYLTVPFVLSWSMLDAMACGCTVLSSDVGPVREFIQHDQNGLMAGFYEIDKLADLALKVLADPEAHRRMGEAATRMIHEGYSLEAVFPRVQSFYESTVQGQSR